MFAAVWTIACGCTTIRPPTQRTWGVSPDGATVAYFESTESGAGLYIPENLFLGGAVFKEDVVWFPTDATAAPNRHTVVSGLNIEAIGAWPVSPSRVLFAPSGRRLLAYSLLPRLALFDLDKRESRVLGLGWWRELWPAGWLNDEEIVFVVRSLGSARNFLYRWKVYPHVESPVEMFRGVAADDPAYVWLSPNGRHAFLQSRAGASSLLNVVTGEVRPTPFPTNVNPVDLVEVAWSPDSSRLAILYYRRQVEPTAEAALVVENMSEPGRPTQTPFSWRAWGSNPSWNKARITWRSDSRRLLLHARGLIGSFDPERSVFEPLPGAAGGRWDFEFADYQPIPGRLLLRGAKPTGLAAADYDGRFPRPLTIDMEGEAAEVEFWTLLPDLQHLIGKSKTGVLVRRVREELPKPK